MAFVSGTANSFADLLAAIQTACTGNGWTLSGQVLHKGTCYVRVRISGNYIAITSGRGIDVNNALTDMSNAHECKVGQPGSYNRPLTWPAIYDIHIHTATDEVFVVLRYGVNTYQWLAWGQSPVAGISGTGNWYGGSIWGDSWYVEISDTAGSTRSDGSYFCPALFWWSSWNHANGVFDSGLNAPSWDACDALRVINPMVSRSPNSWNGETILIPIMPSVQMASNKYAVVGELAHARYVRLDHYEPGDIITLGADKWMVYPWILKVAGDRNGGNGISGHSGTLGWAIRYDGP